MYSGVMLWTSLVLAANAGAPDPLHLNYRSIQLPITLRQGDAGLRGLILWVSSDEGQTWERYTEVKPSDKCFKYFAPQDGAYCFTIQALPLQGDPRPRDVYKAPVGQRLVVDTTRPEVSVKAERQGDEVVVQWTMKEKNPSAAKLEYRIGTDAPREVRIGFDEQGRTSFRPERPGPVTVRLEVTDRAGNVGEAQSEVAATTTGGAGVTPVARASGPGATNFATPVGLTTPAPEPPSPAPTGNSSHGASSGLPGVGGTPSPLPEKASEWPSGGDRPTAGANATERAETRPEPYAKGPVATSRVDPPNPVPPMNSVALNAGQRGALPELRLINRETAQLEFEVAKYGPSGLGSVDVFVTYDEGANWEPMRDVQVSLPTPAEMHGSEPVHGSVTVRLTREEVVYGFYLVVKSRAGLGKPAPAAGDPPQVRLERDMHRPDSALCMPVADPDRKGNLLLCWMVKDRNLTATPVTLLWAQNPQGPWQPIGEPELANNGAPPRGAPPRIEVTGHYSWRLPDNIPPNVYLRLVARDNAGNMSIAQTTTPCLIDLEEPVLSSVTVKVSPR